MYTPRDIEQVPIDTLDRPYAGWMWLAGRYVTTHSAQRRRLLAEVSLGVLGPSAQQAQFQTKWHEIIHSPEPLGWNTQIKDDLAINLQGKWEEGLVHSRGFHLASLAEVGVGSVANFIGIGAPIRLGWVGDLYAHAGGFGPADRPGTDLIFTYLNTNKALNFQEDSVLMNMKRTIEEEGPRCPSQGYFFVHPGVRFVAQNSLLQGGWFNGARSEHTFSGAEIENFYAQMEVGVGFNTHWFGITFSQFFRTREFNTGDPSHWGAFSLHFLINGRCCNYSK